MNTTSNETLTNSEKAVLDRMTKDLGLLIPLSMGSSAIRLCLAQIAMGAVATALDVETRKEESAQ